MDAAEKLFSLKGYFGASTREITREAGVPLGLVSYHFGTKEELYTSVISRRAEEHIEALLTSLREVKENAEDGQPALDEIIRAFIRPIVERSLHGGEGWKSYVKLLSRAANANRHQPNIEVFTAIYSPVEAEFVELLKARFPDADPEDIYWSFYFMSSAIIHFLVENGSIDNLSGGLCQSSDLERVMEKMVPFFEAGMIRLNG